jgi:Tfp pilus assembly PilM family ATPase
MLKRWLNRAEPIGCHIGGGRVRLAQVQGPSSAQTRIVAAERPLSGGADGDPAAHDAAVAALLADMLRSSPFRGSRVVSCPPPGAARYVTMRLAPMPAADLAHAAHWKLANDLGVGTGEFKSAVLNVVEVRDAGKQKTEAVVVSATLAHLDRHVAVIAAAGLEHVAIDDPACAVSRSTGVALDAGGMAAASADARVVLDLRDDEAFLAIATGADLSFVRPVGDGLSQLNKTLADLLEVTPAEALELQTKVLAAVRAGGGGDDVARPANWAFAVPFQRAREAIADASRMYGRELARQVALAMYYYSTAATSAAPATGVVVSDRTIDPAVLEAVTVQSGIDLAAFDPPAFDPAASTPWAALPATDAGRDPSTWATAVGLSLYEHGPAPAKEAA